MAAVWEGRAAADGAEPPGERCKGGAGSGSSGCGPQRAALVAAAGVDCTMEEGSGRRNACNIALRTFMPVANVWACGMHSREGGRVLK